jgi:colanic acid/amylovoran biosynthesis glycosyltransferase
MGSMEFNAAAKLDKWWKPKAGNLLGVLYTVMLITSLHFSKALLLFFPSVLTIFGIGCFGHFINDLYDREADAKANKFNRIAALPGSKRNLLLGSALVIALVPWIALPFDSFSVFLLALEFVCLLVYSIPPVRLKEKKIWPILTDGAYAYAIPALLASHTFFLAAKKSIPVYFFIILFCWQWLYGIRHYLNHLALDRVNDLKTQTVTLATSKGNNYILRLISWYLLPAEILLFVAFQVYIHRYNQLLPFLVFYVFVFIYFTVTVQAISRGYRIFVYRFTKSTPDYFYQYGWSYAPLLLLIWADWKYLILGLIHWFLFNGSSLTGNKFKRSYEHFIYQVYYTPLLRFLFYPAIFIKRKLFPSRKSPQEIAIELERVKTYRGEFKIKHPTSPNIAVININKSKYSETFITELIPRLKYNVYFLYGGELPLYDASGDYFLTSSKGWRLFLAFIENCFHLEADYFLKQSITNYLHSKKIQLVLAEFGPVGVRTYPITRSIGIPLIVNFHGYDVYETNELKIFAEAYKGLFEEAKKIIGVSACMIDQLEQMGAPRDKLIHLPAYVNLELFPYCDHSIRPAGFISVGRFSETKSPHLTILAFYQLIREIPEATLTFIGKGGGGELYETCLILVRSLGLEKNVYFKGVLSHNEVAEEMRKARVFVQHSVTTPEGRDMEGKPVAIMEAMACGLPVISTFHSGIPELIEHEVNGLLVDEFDIQTMSRYMLLLARDDRLVKHFGIEASRHIHEHPLISHHVSILEELIDDSISQ